MGFTYPPHFSFPHVSPHLRSNHSFSIPVLPLCPGPPAAALSSLFSCITLRIPCRLMFRRPCGFFSVLSLFSPPPPPSCLSAPSAGSSAVCFHSAGFQRCLPAPAAVSLPPRAEGFSPGAAPLNCVFLAAALRSGPLSCEHQMSIVGSPATAAPAVEKGARGRDGAPEPLAGALETLLGGQRWPLARLPRLRMSLVCLRSVENQSAAG